MNLIRPTVFTALRRLACCAFVALAGLATQANATTFDFSFAEINGGYYPSGNPALVFGGSQLFSLPGGEQIVSASLSGTWGDTSQFYGSSARAILYFDGIVVTDGNTISPDPYSNVVSWSYTFTDFSSLLDGQGVLTYSQTTGNYVRLSATNLHIETQAVPDGAATVALLGGAMLGLVAFRRRFVRA